MSRGRLHPARGLGLALASAAFLLAAPPLAAQPVADPGAERDGRPQETVRGTVRQLLLTPRGEVDGLLLGDGTQVHFPPHLSTQIAYLARPGERVAVTGRRVPPSGLIEARDLKAEASGLAVTDNEAPRQRSSIESMNKDDMILALQGRPNPAPAPLRAKVESRLFGPNGEVNGLLLEGGAILRVPPHLEASSLAAIQPGQTIAVRGREVVTPMGKVIAATQIEPAP